MKEQSLKNKSILILDDEPDLLEILSSEFEFFGAKVYQAGSVNKAKLFLTEVRFDLIISDVRMPGGTGIDLLKYLHSNHQNLVPLVLITGFADLSLEEAFNLGAQAVLNKPFQISELIKLAMDVTLPAAQRFTSEIIFKKKLVLNYPFSFADLINSKKLRIGTGGLSLTANPASLDGLFCECFYFEFHFSDILITGSGICRWLRQLESNDQMAMGLEFINLEKETFDFLQKFWDLNEITSFIPSFS